jgi:4-diphosphocytidyl-2-C-methyl-D-erythritol kinase
VKAHGKINLALVVGPPRGDGKHEVVTIFQRIELADDVELEAACELAVDGFADDTLVRAALESLAAAACVEPLWRVQLTKRIPVAAGLGGGSSDAAAALKLANATLERPLADEELHRIAARLGADVPFFRREGPQLGTGDGTTLEPIELPRDQHVVLLLPNDETKTSTADVYRRFDEREGWVDWEARRDALHAALDARDLAALPANDLASSPHAEDLRELGALRADVSGAGPTVYGLFADASDAALAEEKLRPLGRTWLTRPAW